MCGRFILISPHQAIERVFPVEAAHSYPERHNIAPTQPVLIIREGEAPIGERGPMELAAVEWNFVPEWAKERNSGKPLINARIETVEAKPSFRSSIKRRRCLIPANGWYEWKSENGRKQPYFIEKIRDGANNGKGQELMAFAGIWSVWHGPGGDNWLETVAILTAEAKGPLRATHHRKPLILEPRDYDRWLMPHDPLPRGFLKSFEWMPETAFQARPVSTKVNSVRFDDPSCLAPPESERQPSLF